MIIFKPWGKFRAYRNRGVTTRFLSAAAHESEDVFRIEMAKAKSGIHWPGLPRRSSRPGEYPANQRGALRDSISSDSSATEMTVGSNVPHSIFLREGTSKMARRKMSDNAMQEAVPRVRSMLKGWVEWKR